LALLPPLGVGGCGSTCGFGAAAGLRSSSAFTKSAPARPAALLRRRGRRARIFLAVRALDSVRSVKRFSGVVSGHEVRSQPEGEPSMKRRERVPRLPTRTTRSTSAAGRSNPTADPVADSGGHPQRRSVFGRPRLLSQAQVDSILAWHDSRVSLKQLAESLGVSTSTVVHVITTRGSHYKQAPPEQRAAAMDAHRAHLQALEEAHLL